jgi:C-terminal processing protease CtpA/Prc
VLTGLVLISASSQDAQTQPQLSVEALRQDFTIFRQALEEVHPGLYEHTQKPDLDAKFGAVYSALLDPLTDIGFYRRLSPIIATIHCYHTGLQLSTLSLKRFDNTQKILPLDIRVLGGRPYVFRNFGAANVPLGSEILAINGAPAHEIIARLLTNAVLPTDGLGLPGRYRKLSRPLSFSRQLALQITQSKEFSISLKTREVAEVSSVQVAGLTTDQIRDNVQYRSNYTSSRRPLDFRILDSKSTAVLTIASFQEESDYESFLAQAFKRLKEAGIQRLIIDLRNNGGGEDEYGAMLVSYLVSQPFAYYRSLQAKNDHFAADRYAPDGFDAAGFAKRLTKGADRMFYVGTEFHSGLRIQQPRGDHFDGTVYVLINGLTGSAAVECSAIIHTLGRGIFVGEETGGGYGHNSSGDSLDIVLPNSKLRVSIPVMRYSLAVKPGVFEHHGLIPDYQIQSTIEDLIKGADPEMDFVLHRIAAQRSGLEGNPPVSR